MNIHLGEVKLQVCIRKEKLNSPWVPFKWSVCDVLPAHLWNNPQDEEMALHATVRVYQDELQGYFLNLDGPNPQVYCLLRFPDEDHTRPPELGEVTFSYEEAARWMDSNEEVQSVPMPDAISAWLSELVQASYKPEPKRRKRPASFVAPQNR